MQRNHLVTLEVASGRLQPRTPAEKLALQLYQKALPEGARVQMVLTVEDHPDKSLVQLALVHSLIRELAWYCGYTPREMKKVLKYEAGLQKLSVAGSLEEKSFAECSKEELSLAIQIGLQLADLLGVVV